MRIVFHRKTLSAELDSKAGPSDYCVARADKVSISCEMNQNVRDFNPILRMLRDF